MESLKNRAEWEPTAFDADKKADFIMVTDDQFQAINTSKGELQSIQVKDAVRLGSV